MKKGLWQIFGPVLVALFALLLFLFIPWEANFRDSDFLNVAASSGDATVFKGEKIKEDALKEGYIPFFGSSELSRFSPFHPSALAEKYQRNYRPLLLGAPGTQSLTQFLGMNALNLENKKAVLIISPQWFVKEGLREDSFAFYYSPLQVSQWIENLKIVEEKDKYLARRLLSYKKVKEDHFLKETLESIEKGEINEDAHLYFSLTRNLYAKEDELFSFLSLKKNYRKTLEKDEKLLPPQFNFADLDHLAFKIGERETKSNHFGIKDQFYHHRLAKNIEKLKNSQKNLDYRYSKEFGDFELILDNFAKKNTDCLFIIPPVNKKWSDYTGLSQEMLKEFGKKITFQLEQQGFKHILNLNDYAGENYFMEDTIHLGWRGWLKIDESLTTFLGEKSSLTYKIDPSFYSEEWEKRDPETI